MSETIKRQDGDQLWVAEDIEISPQAGARLVLYQRVGYMGVKGYLNETSFGSGLINEEARNEIVQLAAEILAHNQVLVHDKFAIKGVNQVITLGPAYDLKIIKSRRETVRMILMNKQNSYHNVAIECPDRCLRQLVSALRKGRFYHHLGSYDLA